MLLDSANGSADGMAAKVVGIMADWLSEHLARQLLAPTTESYHIWMTVDTEEPTETVYHGRLLSAVALDECNVYWLVDNPCEMSRDGFELRL
jgi:hypothetical protein